MAAATTMDLRAGCAVAVSQQALSDSTLPGVVALSAAVATGELAGAEQVRSALAWRESEEALVSDQQPMFAHFMPAGLGLIVTKVSVLSLSARLRTVQKRIEEMEEEDEEAVMNIELADVLAPSRHKHEVSIWKGFGRNLRVGVTRDLAIISVQRIYERLAMELAVDTKMAKSLVKNVPRSTVRKADRWAHAGSLVYMSKVASSAFKAQIMFWLALFTVNQAIDTYYHLRAPTSPDANAAVGLPVKQETYLKRLVVNALRCSGACALAALGAAVGAAIKPGIGATLGMNIAPQFVYVFI